MSAVVGLMGGICSGKSTVAQMLEKHGFTLVDADEIAHEMLDDTRIQKKLRMTFGDEIIADDGSINNSVLAQYAFNCSETTKKLNDIMHPPIIEEIDERIDQANAPVLLDAALLVEKGLHYHYCEVLVFVDAPLTERQKRAEQNRGWDPEEVRRREKLQVSVDRKKELADIVVKNSGSLEQLADRIPEIERKIRELLSD